MSFSNLSCSLPFYKSMAASLAEGASLEMKRAISIKIQLVEKFQLTLYSVNLLNKFNILIF